MNLDNLIKANKIQWDLIDFYLDRIHKWYPNYFIMQSGINETCFVFYLKSEIEKGIYKEVTRIHYTQLSSLTD